jgi:prepilin-type N-terminal cleavage/methylation domain-containing protein
VSKISKQTGFTLVEMLVAIAVALVFMGGMLFSRGDFDSTVRLGSITREVALFAREAQTYGAGGGSDVNVGTPHGVYFDEDESNSEITLYADDDESGSYDSGEELETLELPNDYIISSPSEFDVYFTRPTLRANFNKGSGVKTIVVTHTPSGKTREAKISTSGYISTP